MRYSLIIIICSHFKKTLTEAFSLSSGLTKVQSYVIWYLLAKKKKKVEFSSFLIFPKVSHPFCIQLLIE